MYRFYKRGLIRSALFLYIAALVAFAAQPDRIGPMRETRSVQLRGTVNPRVNRAVDQGSLDPATLVSGVTLIFTPTAAQQAALDQLLEEQRDPASPNYHQWLTPEQFGEQFGVSGGDMATVSSWLQAQGFTIENSARASNWISFSGTAGNIGTAFHTELHRYLDGTETHFANATEISIPAAFSGVVGSVRGMNDFRPKPMRQTRPLPLDTTSAGVHYLAPGDIATIYDIAALYSAGYDGTGQKLAIVGQTDISLTDLRGFRSQFGLAAKDPTLVLTGTDPGVSSADVVEAALDLEWSGAVARNATIYYVYSTNVFTSVQYAIDQATAPVISMSYGSCETGSPTSYRTMAQQANAEGITWMNASGDSGAAGCDYDAKVAVNGPAVLFPADIPEVTAVGGTEFNETGSTGWSTTNSSTLSSATSYLPEKAWNDSTSSGIAASGGGASTLFTKPWWQAGTGVPADSRRDVPDVAMSASATHDGYLVYSGGADMLVGGTSAATPVFAGIVAIANQYLVAKGVQKTAGLGNINPDLYSLAAVTTNGIFHDITVGNNIVSCTTGTTGCTTGSFGYTAGTGYDMVTGLGSVDAYNMVTKWTSLPAAVGTTMTMTASPTSIAQSASTTLTVTMKAVTGTTSPSGSVTFSDGSVSLGSVALVSGVATLSVKGTSLTAGSNTLTANYVPTGNFAGATASATVSVTVPLVSTTSTLTAAPASIATTGSTVLTVTVKAASGTAVPSGTVNFLLGTKSLGTGSLNSSATSTLTIAASVLATGANTVTATYAGNSSFSTSTGTAVVTVTAPAVATTTVVSANPATIAQSASTVLTATVKPATGSTLPTGTVTFSLGSTTLGTGTLASGSATLTVKGASLAVGSNTVTASYAATTAFAASSTSITVVVTGTTVATTTIVAASPTSIAPSANTLVTATVKAASGSAIPTGSVMFTACTVTLGTAALSGTGTASLTVSGSTLTSGSNTITATYEPTGSFTTSKGTVAVTVVAGSVSASLTMTATPSTIATTASTVLAITAKGTSGTPVASGLVTLTNGSTALGSATITSGVASFTVKGTSLAVGVNTITATYSGVTTTVQVTVTSSASNVTLTAAKGNIIQIGFPVSLQVTEDTGIASTLTSLTVNGTDFSSAIAQFFGSRQLPAHGTLASSLLVEWVPLPSALTFVLGGVDTTGHQWSQTTSLSTGK